MSHPNETPSYYVTVSNGRAQLRSSARTGVIQTFGSNIETAIVQGQAIIATSSKGVTYEYAIQNNYCLLYTSPSPRDKRQSRMPSSA